MVRLLWAKKQTQTFTGKAARPPYPINPGPTEGNKMRSTPKAEQTAVATTAYGSSHGEIVALTSLRGFLAAWVVVYHFGNDVLQLFPWTEVLSPIALRGGM